MRPNLCGGIGNQYPANRAIPIYKNITKKKKGGFYMSYRNAARRRQTKGVVLFTVVCILLFLFIMIMSTLSVVSSAQTRTYTKFKENQAYFTARSGLETVTTSLWNYTYNGAGLRTETSSYPAENNKFYRAFLQMMYPVDTFSGSPKRSNQYIVSDTNLTFAEMDSNPNIAKINVTFPQPPASAYNNADLKYLYGECTVYIQKTDTKKARFISHATLGDSESTIVLYVGPKDEPPEVFENALTTFGGAGADNMQVYGGTSLNIDQDPTSPTLNTVTYSNSDTTIQGNQYFNCNMNLDNAKLYPGTNGIYIEGNLVFGNQGKIVATEAESKIYVGGKISSNTGPSIGTSSNKVNLYCDAFQMDGTNFELYGDLYIYGDEPVTIKGKVHGDVYYCGTQQISFENATIDGKLFTNSTNIVKSNGLNINGTDLKDVDLSTVTFDSASGATSKDDVLNKLPKLDDVRATYAPYDGSAGTFSGWGYKKIGTGDEKNSTNYEKYDPSKLSQYINNDGWVEWPGFYSLPYDASTGYYYIDATTNDVNYHVSSSYSDFIPNDKKLMIKGTNNVNFYFDQGNYYLGNRSHITNDSIYNKGSIELTTAGANNINLKTNMYFWGNSTLNTTNDSLINAYILAPEGTLNIATANGSLPGVSSIKYDGVSISNSTVLGMGSLVFNKITTANAPKFFFVRKPSTAPDPDKPGKFWKDLYYFNR